MIQVAAILVGAAAGLALFLWSRRLGRAQPRFWMQVLIVMQVLYLVFAGVARHPAGALREALVLVLFTAIAWVGFRLSSWFLAFGIFVHGLWDLRHLVVGESYVVPLYPEACVGFDWLVFFYLLKRAGAWQRQRRPATAEEVSV